MQTRNSPAATFAFADISLVSASMEPLSFSHLYAFGSDAVCVDLAWMRDGASTETKEKAIGVAIGSRHTARAWSR